MAVLMGIDEAGFGPILGPLVVSSATLQLQPELVEHNLWNVLAKSVGDQRKHLAGRVLIADSKKAYCKTVGIKHLQRTVLTCLKCLRHSPATLAELLSITAPDCAERIRQYPWYERTDAVPLDADPGDIAIAAAMLSTDLRKCGITLLDVQSRCLDVALFNQMIAAVNNKARVLFSTTSVLIKGAFDRYGNEGLHVVADRQGGRARYRRHLRLMFPNTELKIISEDTKVSSYEIRQDRKVMSLHFVVGGDRKYLPVALASMVSKYLRELLIGCINSYFLGHHPQLRPTAGYWKDGLRFLEDLKAQPQIRFDPNLLIRCR